MRGLIVLLVLVPSAVAEPLDDGSGMDYPLTLSKVGLVAPRIEGDRAMDKLLRDPLTIWYRLPVAWQRDRYPDRFGKRRPWGLFLGSFDALRNANADFPWEGTVGLNAAHKADRTGGSGPYGAVNFLRLPDDGKGGVVPVLVLSGYPVRWMFPPGTMVGEMIYVVHKGKKWTQEVRVRKKGADSKTWFPSVYRPLANRRELETFSSLSPTSRWGKKFLSFRNPEEDEVFALKGLVDVLPDLPADEVERVLRLPFKDVTADDWSPAAGQDFHVLPRDYSFGLLGPPDSKVCSACHRQTQTSVRELIPREPSVAEAPERMGSIRGSDAVFTWHPFHARGLAKDDGMRSAKAPLRRWDVERGAVIVKPSNYDGPLPADYRLTLFVQESLASYELPPERFLHPAPARRGKP